MGCTCGCMSNPALKEKLDAYAASFIENLSEENAGPLRRADRDAMDRLHSVTRIVFGWNDGARAVVHVSQMLRDRAAAEQPRRWN